MANTWKPDQEVYLRDISRACEMLSIRFKQEHDHYSKLEARFQLPAVVISATLGVAAFGNSQFNADTQRSINITMGVVGLCLGILNSIQSYLKIGTTMSGCLLASSNLQKLKEHIDLELALPTEDRSHSGLVFLRDAYNNYEKHVDAAPSVLKRVRFIKSPIQVVVERSDIGEAPSTEV